MLVALFAAVSVSAQPLFTYGKKQVSKEEFLRAFNKNPSTTTDRQKALREYLDLYINFKLKVQAAYDSSLDKDNLYQTESFNFKKQLAENVMNDEANIKGLITEAFTRSQKDLRLSQVFVEVTNGDTTNAYQQIWKAYKELQAGKEFDKTAKDLSSDAGVKQNGGDMGYITVFSLPYIFENTAYNLKQGDFSQPFRSSIGYHIFKVTAARKAVGRRKVAQILVPFPPNATDEVKQKAFVKADSVYHLIAACKEKFSDMVTRYSNDVSSYNSGGVLPEFGVGQYSPAFEDVVFTLAKKGDLSKPFATAYGYHILQLIETVPVNSDANDPVYLSSLKEKVEKDDRLTKAKKLLVDKWLQRSSYKPATYLQDSLWRFADTVVAGKSTAGFKKITDKTILFSFSSQNITALDFGKFTKAIKTSGNPLKSKSTQDLLKEYVKITASEYYGNHLDAFNMDYKNQVSEFNEANLLFAIMDKQVWGKAGSDEAGLKNYYNSHKEKYQWNPSADALLITCSSDSIAGEVRKALVLKPNNWRSITEKYGNIVAADSGRYELGQIPVFERTAFAKGIITSPVKNTNDNTYSFAYIFNVYSGNAQRSFEDARGMVINDYQQVLEQKWIEQLKKKYPITVKEAVWKTIK